MCSKLVHFELTTVSQMVAIMFGVKPVEDATTATLSLLAIADESEVCTLSAVTNRVVLVSTAPG
jgi:hypothetical protein